MHRFAGVLRHEIRMSLRRKSLWIAYGLLFLFYTVLLFSPPPLGERIRGEVIPEAQIWSVAGRFLVAINVFFPVAVGILSADRVERDGRLGLRELQESTPLSRPAYVLAKYFAALASALFPVALWLLGIAIAMTLDGHAPLGFLYAVPVAFLAITVPAFAFVVAFSLACPMVMPLSVYQILFTGYWFWANFIPPRLFPTLNGTLVTPSGMYALEGFFSGRIAAFTGPRTYTASDAILNLAVLGLCIAAVLLLLERYLARQARRA
jgi:ABC-2 type transport system permease protein